MEVPPAQKPVRCKAISYPGSGFRMYDAAVKHGAKMLTLAEALPFFGKHELWKAYKQALSEVRPIFTRTHAAFSRPPLGETIQKEGNRYFLVESLGGDELGLVWRQEIRKSLLTLRTMKKTNQLFIVENGVTTREHGNGKFTSLLRKENDMRVGDIPRGGRTKTTEHPFLFGCEIEELGVRLVIPGSNVKVGLVAAGISALYPHRDERVDCPLPCADQLPSSVVIPMDFSDLYQRFSGVLEYAKRNALGAKAKKGGQERRESGRLHAKSRVRHRPSIFDYEQAKDERIAAFWKSQDRNLSDNERIAAFWRYQQ